MDRRTAAVLVVIVVLMIAAGVGLVLGLRHLQGSGGTPSGPEDLMEEYAEEVERRCDDHYPRYPLGGPPGHEGRAAPHYVLARDSLPELEEQTWDQLEQEPGATLSDGAVDFREAVDHVREGARATHGRSPYAFCAIDTEGTVLLDFTKLSAALTTSALQEARAGREQEAASMLEAGLIMELDMGRGGGTLGHAMTASMVEDSIRRALVRYVGSARDPKALASLVASLQGIDGSWLDLADNTRIDGLVLETLFAQCFMGPGWKSPVGPPVIRPEDRDTVCAMGPLTLSQMWKGAHERSRQLVDALGESDPAKRVARLEKIDAQARDTSLIQKILSPDRLFSDLAHLDMVPQVQRDIRSHTLLAMLRAAAAIRLHHLRTGSLLLPATHQDWSTLDGESAPLVDPLGQERFEAEMTAEALVIRSASSIPGPETKPVILEVPYSTLIDPSTD